MMAANDNVVLESKMAAFRERTFSVKEKIVLHLGKFVNTQMDFYKMPYAVTQDGIAISVQISRAHSSIELKKLKEKELVKESQAHVTKGNMIRKVYLLSEEGRKLLGRLENELKTMGVTTEQILVPLRENGTEKRDPYVEIALNKTMRAAQDLMALRDTKHRDYKLVISELLSAASTLVGKP